MNHRCILIKFPYAYFDEYDHNYYIITVKLHVKFLMIEKNMSNRSLITMKMFEYISRNWMHMDEKSTYANQHQQYRNPEQNKKYKIKTKMTRGLWVFLNIRG